MATIEWTATAFGALDVRAHPAFENRAEILVTPTVPGDPIALFGEGAELWGRLVSCGPLADEDLSERQREIVRDMADMGIASPDPTGARPGGVVPAAWMSSPLHELVYGLVAAVAAQAGIDIVFIKGPALHAQGLREREHSGDVDVWVDPARTEDLIDELTRWGWQRVPFDFHESMYHSVTMEGSAWGCEIDVHYRFPGMAVAAETAFGRLSAGAQSKEFAGITARIPKRVAHAVVFALHSVRPEPGCTVPLPMREAAVSALRAAGPEVVTESRAFGASAALQPVLIDAYPELPHTQDCVAPPDDWSHRLARTSAGYHLRNLLTLPWGAWPVAIWRILWPSGRKARLSVNDRKPSANGHAAKAHLKRLQKGVRQLFSRP